MVLSPYAVSIEQLIALIKITPEGLAREGYRNQLIRLTFAHAVYIADHVETLQPRPVYHVGPDDPGE